MRSTFFYRTFLLLTFFVYFQDKLIAQDDYTIVTQDLETWSKVGLKFKVNNDFSLGLNQQFRLNENSSSMDQIITNFDTKYKINKSLYFGLGFRYIADKKSDDSFQNDFRYNIDAGYKHSINQFSLNYRLRYQNKNEIGFSKTDGDDIDHVFRLKIGAEYNIKNWKLDPQFSTEIFNDLTQSTDKLYKVRFTLATDYSINKMNSIGAFYRLERELNESYPKTTYIIGLNYKFTLKFNN